MNKLLTALMLFSLFATPQGICESSSINQTTCEQAKGYLAGPPQKDTSIAAKLAEEFMKTQPDAKLYSAKATAVYQNEAGVYSVRFNQLKRTSKNDAIVEVVLKDKTCRRVKVK